MFGRCEGLKSNEEYQSIWENRELSTMERWTKAHEFKINFVCEEFKSLFIEYLIEFWAIIETKEDLKDITERGEKPTPSGVGWIA